MAKKGRGWDPWQRGQSIGRIMLLGVETLKLYKQPQIGWHWDICSLRNEWAWRKRPADDCKMDCCSLMRWNSNKHFRDKLTLNTSLRPGWCGSAQRKELQRSYRLSRCCVFNKSWMLIHASKERCVLGLVEAENFFGDGPCNTESTGRIDWTSGGRAWRHA